MVNLVFGIEGKNPDPVISELEFLDYKGRNIFIPQQLSERILLYFLKELLSRYPVCTMHMQMKISATRNSETHLFPIREIRYLESVGNLVSIVSTNEVFEVYATLRRIETAIKSFGFIQIHGSFLISVFHIRSYNARCVTMDDGKEINIGRKYIRDFRKTVRSLNVPCIS